MPPIWRCKHGCEDMTCRFGCRPTMADRKETIDYEKKAVMTKHYVTEIDQSRLDQEWFEHPPLVEDWGTKKAEADDKVRRAEDKLSLVKAQVRLDARKYPSKFRLDEKKATTDDVAAAVLCDPRVQDAIAKLRDWEAEAGHCKAMLEGLDHRRTSMSKAVELLQMGYRSEPRVSNNHDENRTGMPRKQVNR